MISESDLQNHRKQWSIPDDVTYLNHGSFGPSPRVVQDERRRWSERLERQPMDFFIRQMEDALDQAENSLAEFIGADADEIVFVDNATAGMNIVANSTDLKPGDEVLLTDQEYGAVVRLWQRVCDRAGARVIVQQMPYLPTTHEDCADALMAAVTSRTRLIVVSHVTSPTAVVLPIDRICRAARAKRIPVCIDGPHALAMLPLNMHEIGCDYYTASCHKWLCAPFGSGFLYVGRDHHATMAPAIVSWGSAVGERSASWKDEFRWLGTRDPAAYLSVPTAIDFLRSCGIERFRSHYRELVAYARERLIGLWGSDDGVITSSDWLGSMIVFPLPAGRTSPPPGPGRLDPLQKQLWDSHRIELPVIHWSDRRLIRVSCHLYNGTDDIDRLIDALTTSLNGT